MKTVYIDIYFLINFCVDIIALAIALYILKIKKRIFEENPFFYWSGEGYKNTSNTPTPTEKMSKTTT